MRVSNSQAESRHSSITIKLITGGLSEARSMSPFTAHRKLRSLHHSPFSGFPTKGVVCRVQPQTSNSLPDSFELMRQNGRIYGPIICVTHSPQTGCAKIHAFSHFLKCISNSKLPFRQIVTIMAGVPRALLLPELG